MDRKQAVLEQVLEDQKVNHKYLVNDTKLEVTNQIQESQSIMDAKLSKNRLETDKNRQECLSQIESIQNQIDEDKLAASNNLIKLQTALHSQIKEQKVHTELLAKEQLTSMAEVNNRMNDHREFAVTRMEKISSHLDGKIEL